MGLQFKIAYKKGKENKVVDASRIPAMMAIQAVSAVQPLWIQEVINSYATDQQALDLVAQLTLASPNEHDYSLHQGVVRKGSLIWVAKNSALRTRLIVEFHSSAVGGGAL
jgi:hypothetical protein